MLIQAIAVRLWRSQQCVHNFRLARTTKPMQLQVLWSTTISMCQVHLLLKCKCVVNVFFKPHSTWYYITSFLYSQQLDIWTIGSQIYSPFCLRKLSWMRDRGHEFAEHSAACGRYCLREKRFIFRSNQPHILNHIMDKWPISSAAICIRAHVLLAIFCLMNYNWTKTCSLIVCDNRRPATYESNNIFPHTNPTYSKCGQHCIDIAWLWHIQVVFPREENGIGLYMKSWQTVLWGIIRFNLYMCV